MLKEDMIKWLTIYKRFTIKQTSYDTLARTMKNYIFPMLGEKETNKIDSDDVMELLIDLQYNQQRAYSTVKKVKDALHDFYNYAAKRRMADTNIVDICVLRNFHNANKPAPRSLSFVEIRRFTDMALMKNEFGDYRYFYGPLMLVYLHTGCRLGELLGCSPEDYNPETGDLHIHSNLETVTKCDEKGQLISGCEIIHQDTAKTIDSNRTIKLNLTARRYFNIYYKAAVRANSEYIVMSPRGKGKHASPYSVQHTFTYIAKAAELKDARGIHTLRHTFATHLLQNKVDIKVVSKVLGHASVKITYDTYIHLFDTEVTDAMLILDDVFAIA